MNQSGIAAHALARVVRFLVLFDAVADTVPLRGLAPGFLAAVDFTGFVDGPERDCCPVDLRGFLAPGCRPMDRDLPAGVPTDVALFF